MNLHIDENSTVTMDGMNSFCMSMMGIYPQHGAGNGMIMYMDGFRSSLTESNLPCLNLYFPTWTLNTKTKFITAMIGVFIVSVLVEGLSKFRHYVHSISKSIRKNNNDSDSFFGKQKPLLIRITITMLHGFQAFMGYILMLAVMTFSIELVTMVVLGLATGFAIFFCNDHFIVDHVTANPCCNFMQEEAREIRQPDSNCIPAPCVSSSTAAAASSSTQLPQPCADETASTTVTTNGSDCETALQPTTMSPLLAQQQAKSPDCNGGTALLLGYEE